jgi:SAM-dependent methyltransferase
MKTGASQVTSLGWFFFLVILAAIAALASPILAHCRSSPSFTSSLEAKLDRVLAHLAAAEHDSPAAGAPLSLAAAPAAAPLRAAAAAVQQAAPPVPQQQKAEQEPAPRLRTPPSTGLFSGGKKVKPAAAAAPAAAPAAALQGGSSASVSLRFPTLTLNEEERPWFDLAINNPVVPSAVVVMPAGIPPLASLPYPPGLPSIAAYKFALASDTYAAMERFSAAFIEVNKALVNEYQWHRDPLHAWSRKYEYVWHAEALRAALPPAHAQSLAATWPDQAAPPQAQPYYVLDAGSGFTFYDQYVASRLGVQLVALDNQQSYVKFFGGLATAMLPGEAPVPAIPYVLASIEVTGLPDASLDAITCVSVLEHVAGPDLLVTVQEFKRILKPGGRLVMTFDSGQPPIAKNMPQSKELLEALRAHMVEDVTHSAPEALLSSQGEAASLFSNRRATPPEFGETIFSISAHVFINAK